MPLDILDTDAVIRLVDQERIDLTIPFPRSGQATLSRTVSGAGITAHLRLRVTVTSS